MGEHRRPERARRDASNTVSPQPAPQAPIRPLAEAQATDPIGRPSSPITRPQQLLALQRAVGNRAVARTVARLQQASSPSPTPTEPASLPGPAPVIQRFLMREDKSPVPVNWDGLTYDEVVRIYQATEEGLLIPEPGDMDKLIAAGERLKPKAGGLQAEQVDWANLQPYQALYIQSLVEDGTLKPSKEQLSLLDNALGVVNEPEGMEEEFDSKTLNPDQEELKTHFDTEVPKWHSANVAKKAKKKQKTEKYRLPGKTVQGNALEFTTSSFLGMMDVTELNTNTYAMNSPGVDHLQDDPRFLFVQDKLHLSPHTANTQSYRDHYKNRKTMAKNLVKALGETNKKRGKDLHRMLTDTLAKDTWINKGVLQTIVTGVNNHVAEVQRFEASLDDFKDNRDMPVLEDDDDLVTTIADSLAFTVPRDIWELLYHASESGEIPKEEMHAYIRLDMSTDEFAQVLQLFDTFVAPYNEKSKREDDEAYEDTEPPKKRRKKDK